MAKKLAVIPTVLAILSMAWGPATHVHIAQETMRGLPLSTTEKQALNFGAVAPDMRLFVDRNMTAHQMLHAQAFFDKLKSMAVTAEEKAFVKGYQTHLVSDPIERAYTTSKPYIEAPPEVIIDAMLMKDRPALKQVRIVASAATKSLLIRAWAAAYSTYSWQITSAFLDNAVSTFNGYLWSMSYTTVAAIGWATYSDYYTAVQQSIDASRQALGIPAPTATPIPTPTPTPRPWWWR